METIFASFEVIPINENHVKQFHSMLLQYSEKDARHRGNYKTVSNAIEAFDETGRSLGVIFETTTPFDTPREMGELLEWINETMKTRSVHPLLVAAVMVVVFLAIHPFQDGNGRLSRALTTLLLLKAGYSYVPYTSLEAIVEQNKDAYYLALRRTQGTLKSAAPDWTPWVMFFLQSLEKQKVRLEAKVEREKLMQGAMPALSAKILEIVAEHGEVAVRELVLATGSPRESLTETSIFVAPPGSIVLSFGSAVTFNLRDSTEIGRLMFPLANAGRFDNFASVSPL